MRAFKLTVHTIFQKARALISILAMPWSEIQRKRLAIEKEVLEQYIGKSRITWIDQTGETKVDARLTCSNDKQYTLRIYQPQDFPNFVLQLIVKTPMMTRLKRRDGN